MLGLESCKGERDGGEGGTEEEGSKGEGRRERERSGEEGEKRGTERRTKAGGK